MQKYSYFRNVVTILQFLLMCFSVFSCGKKDSAAVESQQPENASRPNGAPAGNELALTARLTPEQVSRIFKDRLNYQTGYTDPKGVFHDAILENFAVSLGGVDFENSFERDPLPKVQTILVSRALAWSVAASLIWWEVNPEAAKKTDRKKVLTVADLKTDFPREAALSFDKATDVTGRDARWRNQLIALYGLVYARPPNTAEINACAEAFATVMKSQKWPPLGWQLIIYSLLSSTEFWNLWGAQ